MPDYFLTWPASIYSGIAASGKFDPMMLTMSIWIVPGIISYVLWSKKMNAQT